jgi:hypothetical protein
MTDEQYEGHRYYRRGGLSPQDDAMLRQYISELEGGQRRRREPEARTVPFGFNPRHLTEQIKIVK